MADLSDQIETASATPAQATVDGNSVTARSIAEQIEADRYLAAKAATASATRGFVLTRLKPPGAV